MIDLGFTMTSQRQIALLALLLAILTMSAAAFAVDKEVPFLAGRVNDLAGLLSESARTELEVRLETLEEATGTQVAILTIPSLDGEVLEDYSLRVAETWKLGRGNFDDGALLLISRDDRKMRLEVGYGLEGTIPDAYSKRILDDVMRPRFRSGDFDGGVIAAVDAISGLIQGDDSLPPPVSEPTGQGEKPTSLVFLFFLVLVGMFSLQALTARGVGAWFLYFFLMPFWLLIPLIMLGRPAGFIPLALWIIGFPILRAISKNSGGPPGGPRTRSGGTFFGPGGGWSSSRGGGWGGGGFSGGGGSFGGGGASGSW